MLSFLRRQSTILLFLALGVAMLYGQRVLLAITSWAHGAGPAIGPNMSGAEVAAEQQAAGWVPAGIVSSKFIVAAGFFCLFLFLIWLVQGLVAPGPKRWAKAHYSEEFQLLTRPERFREYQAARWQLVVLAAAAILAAALVQ